MGQRLSGAEREGDSMRPGVQDEDWQPVPPPGVLLRTYSPGTAGAAEKVSSLGKDWHKFCLKCERCNKTLTPGGHAEHDGKPFCHKPCYATLFGPK
ncbi:PREDICTED: cysteine-rich protein 2-like, partial [Tauraco erythrolophus]|uniref:cysteine-rich protein 2-like n=1 Tax=Tauraco erythrolophus TaxID=121530 RepID=UPI0005231802